MKKALLIFAVLFICLFVFWGCEKTPVDDDSVTQPETSERVDVEEEENEDDTKEAVRVTNSDVTIRQFAWDGWGVSSKTISKGELTKAIIDELSKIPETDETVAAISDKTLDEYVEDYPENSPLERGTMWLEIDSHIYRLSPDLSDGGHVATHLGEGYVINLTDEFRSLVRDAWQYYPHNYYKGIYTRSTDKLTLERAFSADSTVQINIKNIEIEDGLNPTNKITLGLISTITQTTEITLDCQRSADDLNGGDYEKVYLKSGEEKEIELEFGGWDNSYFWIYITADNTRIGLEIDNRTKIDYEYSDITLGVKNGSESIKPVQTFVFEDAFYENGEPAFSADGAGCYQIFDDPRFKVTDLPTVVATEEVTAILPQASRISSVGLYDLDCKPIECASLDLAGLYLLPAGEYIVTVIEIAEGNYVNDGETYTFRSAYEDVFRLVVPEREVGTRHHSLTFNQTYSLADNFDANATYREGERVEIILETVTEQYYRVFVNGEEISMLSSDLSWSVFAFFMPDEDVHIEIEEVSVDIPEMLN